MDKIINNVINITYLAVMAIYAVCFPLGAIFIIFKICGASSMSWIACCVPFVIILALFPIYCLCKTLIGLMEE